MTAEYGAVNAHLIGRGLAGLVALDVPAGPVKIVVHGRAPIWWVEVHDDQ